MSLFTQKRWTPLLAAAMLAAVAVCLPGCGDNGAKPSTYKVEVKSAGTGATGGGDYEAGETVPISAGTAPTGQQFKNWTTTSSGVAFANANSATTTFTMPKNAVTVTAVFEPRTTPPATYAVTVAGAGADAFGAGSYEAGATVIISAGTPPAGQKFKNWTTTSAGVTFLNATGAVTTFIMPANAVTVTAAFEAQTIAPPPATTYFVTVTSAGTNAFGTGNYEAGETVFITAGTAPSGQPFKNWTSTSAGVRFANANSATTSFTMPPNAVTVTANFEGGDNSATTYAVTVLSAGTGAAGSGSYASGATVTISAGTPPSGQQFKNWTVTSGGVTLANANSATTTFTMPKNAVTVSAVFEPQTSTPTPTTYAVTVSSAGTGATGAGSYAAGVTVTISAGTAPSGQKFKNWTTTSSGVTFANANSAATTFTMPANAVTVTAVFEAATVTPSTYKVTVTSTGAAPIGQTGGGDYAVGATVTIFAGTVAAGTNLHFKNWGVTAGSGVTFADQTSETTTFTMPANAVTVTAVFGIVAEMGTFTDDRDNTTYKTATIGGRTWMAENLNYETGNSWCYNDIESNCDLYGRLYDGNTKDVACPDLWHLPTTTEWDNMVTAIGGSTDSGTKLKATSGWTSGNGTDIYGFAALPGGDRNNSGGYLNLGSAGYWWTASNFNSSINGSSMSYIRNMRATANNVSSDYYNRADYGFSIRCVKD